MKNWRRRKPVESMEPTPVRKACVPVPPARPVVSVSRKAHRVGWALATVPAESGWSRSSGSSARSEMYTLPWRRWDSQSFSVSKCWPRGVVTTSPESSSSMNCPSGRNGLPSGGRGGGAGFAYLRSTRAMRWRRAASCCWISSIRFFFAQYSIPWRRRGARRHLVYSECASQRSRPRCGSGAPPAAGHQVAAQGNAAGCAQADRAVCGGRVGFERYRADPVRDRTQQRFDREPLRPRSGTVPGTDASQQAGFAAGTGVRGAESELLLHAAAIAARVGRCHSVRGELRGRRAVPGGAGRFDSRLERGFASGEPDGGRVRCQARQLRDRGGSGAGRRDVELRDRTARGDRKSTRLNSSHAKISYAVF